MVQITTLEIADNKEFDFKLGKLGSIIYFFGVLGWLMVAFFFPYFLVIVLFLTCLSLKLEVKKYTMGDK